MTLSALEHSGRLPTWSMRRASCLERLAALGASLVAVILPALDTRALRLASERWGSSVREAALAFLRESRTSQPTRLTDSGAGTFA